MERTKIALSVVADNTAEARRIMEANAHQIDVAELRLDLMSSFDLDDLLHDRPCPVIVTYRAAREGGRYTGSERARLRVLHKAAALGADYIDCEWDALARLRQEDDLGAAQIIASRHFFEEMPEDFETVHADLHKLEPDIVKVVGMAQSLVDAAVPLEMLAATTVPSICLAMGEKGAISRLLALKYGAFLTFAALDTGDRQAAPGQLTIEGMRRTYQAHLIDRFTEVYGWLTPCEPTQDTVAEVNAALRESGQNAVVVSLATDMEDPSAIITAYSRLGFADFAIHPACGERDDGVMLEDLTLDFFRRRMH